MEFQKKSVLKLIVSAFSGFLIIINGVGLRGLKVINMAQASANPAYTVTGSYIGDGGNGRSISDLGFQPDVVLIKSRNSTTNGVVRTSTMGNAIPIANGLGSIANSINSLDIDGFTIGNDKTVNQNGTVYFWTAFKAAPGELTVGTYTGDGAVSHAISGVGLAPAYVIVMLGTGFNTAKSRSDTMAWGHSFFGENVANNRITSLDGNGFTVGNDNSVNANGALYHYIAWGKVAGRMNTGFYVGDGTAGRNIVGAGFQPENVWIIPEAPAFGSTARPAALDGDHSLAFNGYYAFSNQIQSLIPDGFQVGNSSKTNTNGVTYNWIAWAKTTPPIIHQGLIANGAVGWPYNQTLAAASGSGKYASWNIVAGKLPQNMFLDQATGVLWGKPTNAGIFNFNLAVTDSNNVTSAPAHFAININAGLVVATNSLPDGEIDRKYSQKLAGAGGSGVYSNWTVDTGTLPVGLSLDAVTGVIAGEPTMTGSYNFSIKCTDGNNTNSAAVNYSVKIFPNGFITTNSLASGVVGGTYLQSLNGTGGVGDVTFNFKSGKLPPGLTLNLLTGVISGTPTASGTFNFSIAVTDSFGVASMPTQLAITINPAVPYVLTGDYVGDGNNNRAITDLGFKPDILIIKSGDTTTPAIMKTTTMNGNVAVEMANSNGLLPGLINSLDADGFTISNDNRVNQSNIHYYWTAFQATAGELTLGTYVGTGVPSSINGIGFLPDYVIVSAENGAASRHIPTTQSWTHPFFAEPFPNFNRITSIYNDGFTVGNEIGVNANGVKYHYAAFKKVAGVMNLGAYGGNGISGKAISGVGFMPEDVWVFGEAGNGGTLPVHHPRVLAGDNTLAFSNFSKMSNLISAILNDGFQIENNLIVNQQPMTYAWLAWAKK